jgi:hypothetical protein
MDYITEDGRNLFDEWYRNEDQRVQAEFDATLSILSALGDWRGHWQYEDLHEEHRGLGEIRFSIKADRFLSKWKYRVAGFATLNYRQFILVVGCKKSRMLGGYHPKGAFDTALDLKRRFEEGIGSTYERLI